MTINASSTLGELSENGPNNQVWIFVQISNHTDQLVCSGIRYAIYIKYIQNLDESSISFSRVFFFPCVANYLDVYR